MSWDPQFLPRRDCLTVGEDRYYQDLLYRTVKIGTELEFALPKGVQYENFLPGLEAAMEPSRDMNRLGRLGVFNVVKEHCGIEIQIIGRHPHWESLVEQYSQIVLPLLERRIRMRPTCGLHFHLLQVGSSEDIPEIILANFWNICRKFAPGLKFLTSGGESRDGICRRRQHNAHQEFLSFSPAGMSMSNIQQELAASYLVSEHQNFFNLEHVRFSGDGAVTALHLELRFPDGDLCPVSITAKTFLFLTMLLKAVEISKFGLLDVEHEAGWERSCALMDLLSNNDGQLAASDTSGVTDAVIEELRLNAMRLLRFLKSVFLLLDNPSEIVLRSLAESPVSLRRISGQDWLSINDDLASLIAPLRSFDDTDHELIKIVELCLVSDVAGEKRWHEQVATRLNLTASGVRRRLRGLGGRDPVWDTEAGAMVFLR